MAVRTVSVDLKMKISDFEANAAKAAATTKLLGDEFDNLGKNSNKFSTAKPTREMQNFSRVLTSSLKDGKTGFQSIVQSIDETRTHITNLRKEIASSTGNPTNLFGDLHSAQKDLRTLEKMFKELAPVVEQAGVSAGNGLLNGLESSISGFAFGPLGGPIGIGIISIAAPIIIAGTAAALSAGAGLGIIASAAIIEHNNPVIVRAFTRLSADVKDTLSTAADGLVVPLAGGLATFDKFIRSEGPALKAMFAAVGPDIQLIVAGVDKLASDLIPATTRAAQSFGAAIKDPAVQKSLSFMETSFVQLLDSLGNNPRLVKEGFIALDATLGTSLTILQGLAIAASTFGDALHYIDQGASELNTHAKLLTAIFSPFASLLGTAGKSAQEDTGLFTGLGTAIANASSAALAGFPGIEGLGRSISDLGRAAEDAASKGLQDLQNQMLSMSDSQLGFNQSILDSISTLKAGKKSLNEHTAAGIADNQAINRAIGLNLQQFDSNIKAGKGVDSSTSAYNKNIDALESSLRHAGLLTKGVYDLIESYRKVPAKKSTGFNAPGLAKAKADAGEYGQNIRNIPKSWTTNVTTVFHTKGRPYTGPLAKNYYRWGGITAAADGLLSQAQTYTPVNPGRYMIAEPQTGGEAFIPRRGDYGRSMSILSAAAGWYNASVIPGGGGSGSVAGGINLYVMAGDDTSKALIGSLRYGISQGGGDPIRMLTPRGA